MRNGKIQGKRFLKGDKGSLTTESAVVVPLVLIFVAILIGAYVNVFAGAVRYSEKEVESNPEYADVHRAVSSVFDAGGDIFEMLFGEE